MENPDRTIRENGETCENPSVFPLKYGEEILMCRDGWKRCFSETLINNWAFFWRNFTGQIWASFGCGGEYTEYTESKAEISPALRYVWDMLRSTSTMKKLRWQPVTANWRSSPNKMMQNGDLRHVETNTRDLRQKLAPNKWSPNLQTSGDFNFSTTKRRKIQENFLGNPACDLHFGIQTCHLKIPYKWRFSSLGKSSK